MRQGVCDLISLDLDEKLPFPLRGKDLLAFTSGFSGLLASCAQVAEVSLSLGGPDRCDQQGATPRIQFAPALRDAGRRKTMLGNVSILLHSMRGRRTAAHFGTVSA